MFNLILLAASLIPAEPAQFEIAVESRTPYSLFINGEQIEANTCYKTQPLTEPVRLEIEIRYVCGEEVVKKTIFMDIKPGYKKSIKIVISSKASYAMC